MVIVACMIHMIHVTHVTHVIHARVTRGLFCHMGMLFHKIELSAATDHFGNRRTFLVPVDVIMYKKG